MYSRLRLAASWRHVLKPSIRNASSTRKPPSTPPTASKPPPAKPRLQSSRQESKPKPDTSPPPNLQRAYRIALSILNFFLVTHLVATYIVSIRLCTGPSMLPTIAWEGDWIVLSKLHRFGRLGVGVGDLISYHHPVRSGITGIKRVVGMPGDFVLRDTPREAYGDAEEWGGGGEQWMVQVPEGHCWIVGDNLDASRDSRHFGPLPLALVRGKVVARFWPRPMVYRSALQELES